MKSRRPSSRRPDQVAETVRQAITDALVRGEVRDPRVGLVTVTDVRVTGDLGHAKVLVAIPGEEPAGDQVPRRGSPPVPWRAPGPPSPAHRSPSRARPGDHAPHPASGRRSRPGERSRRPDRDVGGRARDFIGSPSRYRRCGRHGRLDHAIGRASVLHYVRALPTAAHAISARCHRSCGRSPPPIR